MTCRPNFLYIEKKKKNNNNFELKPRTPVFLSTTFSISPRWTTNGRPPVFSIHGRTETHQSAFVCGGEREKLFSFFPSCVPFQAVWSISSLSLHDSRWTLPAGKKKGKKKSQCECNITTLSSYYYSNVQPLYPRFQSAIWLSMMRWLEREMIVCEAIRETGTNGLVYTHTHTHTSIYSIYIVLQCSHNKPPRRIANKNPPNDWLARPLGQWPLSYSLYDGWWVYALRVSTLLAFIFFFLFS